jgi:hypothetical protein
VQNQHSLSFFSSLSPFILLLATGWPGMAYAADNQTSLYVKTDNVKQKTGVATKKPVFRKGDWGQRGFF